MSCVGTGLPGLLYPGIQVGVLGLPVPVSDQTRRARDVAFVVRGTDALEPAASSIETVFSSEQISKRLDELAVEIAECGLERLMVVSILTGSFIFAADLIRAMHKVGVAPEVDFITLSSYRTATTSSGSVEILRDIELDVSGRNVLLVDDILDTGRTLAHAKDLLSARGAGNIRTCVLLEKEIARAVHVEADFRAFSCPDVFVVGYGMDIAYRLRELPYVGRIVE